MAKNLSYEQAMNIKETAVQKAHAVLRAQGIIYPTQAEIANEAKKHKTEYKD